jgi:hypothetical protein
VVEATTLEGITLLFCSDKMAAVEMFRKCTSADPCIMQCYMLLCTMHISTFTAAGSNNISRNNLPLFHDLVPQVHHTYPTSHFGDPGEPEVRLGLIRLDSPVHAREFQVPQAHPSDEFSLGTLLPSRVYSHLVVPESLFRDVQPGTSGLIFPTPL